MTMIHTIKNEFLTVSAENEGAQPLSIKKTGDPCEYLWQGDPQFWNRRAPILFPIVGTLKNNQYTIQGKTYTLPIHGFARNKDFALFCKNENSLVFRLTEDEQTLLCYPFRFALQIRYHLEKNCLNVEYRVQITDDKILRFSIGGHPGFNAPLEPGERLTDYFLEFEKAENLLRYVPVNGLLTSGVPVLLKQGNILFLSPDPFQNGTLIIKNPESEKFFLKNKKTKRWVCVELSGFPFLALWKRSEEAPYVCVEPWFGIPDPVDASGDFTTKQGIISLEPGNLFSCNYRIIIQ